MSSPGTLDNLKDYPRK
ncbi:hypothetical protein Aduo_018463 [Ancylostoma duodenale]